MNQIAKIIQSYEFVYQNETELQEQIESVLKDNDIPFEREYSLDKDSRIDFYLPESKTGIEVKVKSGAAVVSKQLHRYAKSNQIDNLMLVTTRMDHVMLDGFVYGDIRLDVVFIGGF